MKGFALSHKGTIDICADELKELGAEDVKGYEDAAEFKAEPSLMCKLVYRSQSATKFIFDGITTKIKTIEELIDFVKSFDVGVWPDGKKTFCVRARVEESNVINDEVIGATGTILEKKTRLKVNLKEPDIVFFVYLSGETAYFGIDAVSVDVSKRSYKIFHTPVSMKGTLAYCLLRFAGYAGEGVLLDPCAGTGVIPIEAGLFATMRSPHFFNKFRLSQHATFAAVKEEDIYLHEDQMIKKSCPDIYCFDKVSPYVKACQKNAKIAGVDKYLHTLKYDVEWPGIEKGEINYIVSQLRPNKKRFYDGFFCQSAYVLKMGGIVVLLCKDADITTGSITESAKKQGFSIVDKRVVYAGKERLVALKYEKD